MTELGNSLALLLFSFPLKLLSPTQSSPIGGTSGKAIVWGSIANSLFTNTGGKIVVGFFGSEGGRGRVDDSALAATPPAGTWIAEVWEKEEGVVCGSGNGGAKAFREPIVFLTAGIDLGGGADLTGGVGATGIGLAERSEAFLHGSKSSIGDETIVTLWTFGERAV